MSAPDDRYDPRQNPANDPPAVSGRDPADVIREALEYPAKTQARQLDDPDWSRYLMPPERAALAALEDMQQRQAPATAEALDAMYRRAVAAEAALAAEKGLCQTLMEDANRDRELRDQSEAALADANRELAARPTLDEAVRNVEFWKDKAADANQRADDLRAELDDVREHGMASEARANDYADTLDKAARWIDMALAQGALLVADYETGEPIVAAARAALDRHTTPAPTEGGDVT